MATTTPNNWRDSLPPGVDAYAKLINKNWDKFTSTFNTITYTAKQVNSFLLHHILFYQSRYYADIQLWEYFREDFIGWTVNTWALSNINIIRDFRDFLRENRVFIPIDGGIIGDNIQEQVLNAKEEHEWTLQEIKHQIRTIKKFNSQWNPNDEQPQSTPFYSPLPATQASPARPPAAPPIPLAIPIAAPLETLQPPQQPPQESPQQSQQQAPQEPPQTTSGYQTPQVPQPQVPQAAVSQPVPQAPQQAPKQPPQQPQPPQQSPQEPPQQPQQPQQHPQQPPQQPPQHKQARDPLASRSNNLQTLPQQDQKKKFSGELEYGKGYDQCQPQSNRGGPCRGPRGGPGGDPRGDSRRGPRGDPRGDSRRGPRRDPRGDSRRGPRGDPRGDSRRGPRGGSRRGPYRGSHGGPCGGPRGGPHGGPRRGSRGGPRRASRTLWDSMD